MVNTPNLNINLFDDNLDLDNDFEVWYNSLTGLTNSSLKKIDDAFGLPLNRLSTSSKTLVPAINENKNQINILSTEISKRQMKTYTSLSQLELTDSQFNGLSQTQAFDLLIEKMGNYATFIVRCDSGLTNFRNAIYNYGVLTNMLALFEITTYAFTRYTAKISDEKGILPSFECSGYPTASGSWKQISTTEKTEILLLNGWKVANNENVQVIKQVM